ncbi:unnamed protein product [Rhizophagus irregularis]|nr:unnamed protein product [Rhizophagus irregularis]CAB4434725.1 unnamed protein product [Rhizophagus irregularis]CAB4434816.1 unnamed protein product [Rhizophagus irregularis]
MTMILVFLSDSLTNYINECNLTDPNEAPNNHDGLDTYSENEIKSLAEFYGRAKGNGSNIMCEPVLDGNAFIREWHAIL